MTSTFLRVFFSAAILAALFCIPTYGQAQESIMVAGPPAHAPAHGYRAKRLYNYYPGANVYFEPAQNLWFFLSGGVWTFGAALPDTLKIKLGSPVSLELDTDKPYLYNGEHLKKYPPGQAKKLTGPPPKSKGKKKVK